MTWTDGSLGGRVAVVTGASSGIGRSVAEALGAEGAHVVVHGRDAGRLAEVAAAVERGGGRAATVACDLRDEDAPERLVASALQAFGGLDVLVHSAGIFEPRPFAETSLESFDRQVHVNVRAPFALTQAALPHLSEGASVIFISSIAGRIGFPSSAAYCATKGAVELLVRALACELAPAVRVACVAPGNVHTPMNAWQFADSGEYEQSLIDQTPAGRIADVDDIAPAVVFLASSGARFVHGATLLVDGGWTAR